MGGIHQDGLPFLAKCGNENKFSYSFIKLNPQNSSMPCEFLCAIKNNV